MVLYVCLDTSTMEVVAPCYVQMGLDKVLHHVVRGDEGSITRLHSVLHGRLGCRLDTYFGVGLP